MPALGEIRRYYEKRMTPVCPTGRARRDILALLEDRRSLQRAAEALLAAAEPYGADPNVKSAIEGFRSVLERR
ncbi:MAG: hypothetical protein ABR552_02380 [Actinomycetota bacterium]|nr:hypothetical protein [Actinomycetota bacterium]